MSTRRSHAHRRPAKRRRGVGAPILVSLAVAVAVLALGASGTLSSWSQAVIGNTHNDVATATAVILQETSGGTTCRSSDAPTTNSSSCSTINKYGGTGTPLTPGSNQVTDVVFTNLGAANGSSLVLAPGTCSSSPTTGTPTPNNLCSTDLSVQVSCSNGATYSAGSAWTDLAYSGAPGSMPTLTHGAGLAAGASATCRFTVALPATASVLDQGVTVSQTLTWTLNK